jgi:DEAD/DEAH box helicase domain-containing protein
MADGRDLQKAVGSGDAAWFATRDGQGRGQWRDAGGQPTDPEQADTFNPALYLYDNFPGGMGLSEPLFNSVTRLVRDAILLVEGCDCSAGCPACIGPVTEADEQSGATQRECAATVLALLDA